MTEALDRYCTFRVDGLLLGVPVERVLEIRRASAVTATPLAPRWVLGLMNVRGRIATVIDTRHQLGLAPAPAPPAVFIVIETGDSLISLAVDDDGDVVELSGATREPVPETISPQVRSVATDAYQMDDALLLIVRISALAGATRKGAADGRSGD